MLRRLKEAVATELPGKVCVAVWAARLYVELWRLASF
jgi:hypothetical protein